MRRISNPKSFLVLMVAMMTLVDAKHIPRMRGRRYKGHPRNKPPPAPESGSTGVIKALNTSEVAASTPSMQATANSSEPAPAEDIPVGTTGTGGGDEAGAVVIVGDRDATAGEEAPIADGSGGAFNPVAGVLDDRKVTHREEASSARGGGGGGDGERFDGLECEPIGPCVACGDDELGYPYCAATGRRVEVRCTAANADQAVDMGFGQRGRPGGRANAAGVEGGMASMRGSATFRSCAKTEQEEMQELVRFWLVMLALGLVSCIFIRRRQRKGISLYDRRAK